MEIRLILRIKGDENDTEVFLSFAIRGLSVVNPMRSFSIPEFSLFTCLMKFFVDSGFGCVTN